MVLKVLDRIITCQNAEAYNETCAAVGNVFFNFRMFLMTQDAKYMDVTEVALYNNALAGVNLGRGRLLLCKSTGSPGRLGI